MNIEVVNKYKHEPTKYDIYIGRGSILGNPFTSIKDRNTLAMFVCENREESIEKYKQYIIDKIKTKDKSIIEELSRIYKLAQLNKVYLVCYCKPKACHGDFIKEILIKLDSK